MGNKESRLEIDYDIESIPVENLHISYYMGMMNEIDYGEGNLNVSRKEIEEIVFLFLEKARNLELNVIYKTYIDSLTKTIKKEVLIIEDERQEPMTRGIIKKDYCFGTAMKLFFTKGYIYGILFHKGIATARISFY